MDYLTGSNGSVLSMEKDMADEGFVLTISGAEEVTITLTESQLMKLRDWCNLQVPNTPKPRIQVLGDDRWERIRAVGIKMDEKTFLGSLAAQGEKYGSLTETQLAKGFEAASKVFDK